MTDLLDLVARHRREPDPRGPAPLRVAIWGSGPRASGYYAPIVRALGDRLELVGVGSRRLESARALGERAEVPAFADLEEMARATSPDLVIVCVSYAENGLEAIRALDLGLPLHLETPLSHRLHECDVIAQRAVESGLPVQVAEQNFLFPVEDFKTRLVRSGLVGDVHTVQSDWWGFRYHGMSQLRMLAGFDNPVVRVRGCEREVKVWPHPSPWDRNEAREDERWSVGLLEFAWGTLGIYNFTSIAHDAPIRRARELRYYAAGGYGVNEHHWRFTDDRTDVAPVPVEWCWKDVGGTKILQALVARVPGEPEVRWDNPFADLPFDDDRIGVATSLVGLVDAIRDGSSDVPYGVHGGRVDQELCVAVEVSHRNGGDPLDFPLDRSLCGEHD